MGTFDGIQARVSEIADQAAARWGVEEAPMPKRIISSQPARETFQGARGLDTSREGMAVALVNAVMHATRGFTDGDIERSVEVFGRWGGRVNELSRDMLVALAGLREAMVNDAAMKRQTEIVEDDAEDDEDDGGPIDMADAAENYRGGVRIK
jgi:hypothetical protein